MAIDMSATQERESLPAAKNRLRIGPVPGWVEPCPFRLDFCAESAGDVTHLLIDRQIHAEVHRTCHHAAIRLNTRQAVQNESLWRLDFKSSPHQIVLHWIKTHRGNAKFDHANLSCARLVGQAAGSTLQDRMALLLMLDDVRPGDILEWCYTIEERPLLLPEHCAALFALPAGKAVGKFHFSVLFNSSRPMQWKSPAADWEPLEKRENDRTRWAWARENYFATAPEENAPAWFINRPWIQISDCPDWETVAAAFAEAWENGEDALEDIAPELAGEESGLAEKTDKAIRLVQDEYRCLGAPGPLEGQPPAPPGLVARRRYGTGTDLSFLLKHLLKCLGVPARLVLVNSDFRRSVAEMLPAPDLFNHLLVEYEADGKTHWIDAARKGRSIVDFGLGLPVAGAATTLIEPPAGSVQENIHELKESILLDTAGSPSWLAVAIAARGRQAEALRRAFTEGGLEVFERKRLRACEDRFGKARRVGPLQYRDDPAANEFFLAEVFEIEGFLTIDPGTKWYKLDLPNDYIATVLKAPEAESRRAPFALPHPCRITHTIELHSVALPPAIVQQHSIETDYLRFTRVRKTLAGNWTMKLNLVTLADAVPPEDFADHRRTIRKIEADSAWSVLLPPGDSRPNQRRDFAALPTSCNSTPTKTPALPPLETGMRNHSASSPDRKPANGEQRKETVPSNGSAHHVVASSAPPPDQGMRRRKRRRKRDDKPSVAWQIVTACGLAVTLLLIVYFAAKYSDKWGIFRKRPPPPPTPATTLQ